MQANVFSSTLSGPCGATIFYKLVFHKVDLLEENEERTPRHQNLNTNH